MQVRRTWLLVWVCAALMTIVACGQGSPGPTTRAKNVERSVRESTIASCLVKAGAAIAKTPRDIAFFHRAQDDEAADKAGFVGDRSIGALVDIWLPSGDESTPPKWALWAAQPFEREPSLGVGDLVDRAPARSWVIYAERPDRKLRSRTNKCLRSG